jgi:hypothetical protein
MRIPSSGEKLELIDGDGFSLGHFTVRRTDGTRVIGSFSPAPDFAHVRDLFAQFAGLVNSQQFSSLDEVSKEIDSLDVCAHHPSGDIPVTDLQIFMDTQTDENASFIPAA